MLKRKAVTHLFGESASGAQKDNHNYRNDMIHRKRLPYTIYYYCIQLISQILFQLLVLDVIIK